MIEDRRYELSTNRYVGAVNPEGYQLITSFRLDPFPIWTYEIDGIVVEKSLFMVHGENTTVVQWRRTDDLPLEIPITLELRPLVAFRDHHHLRHENGEFGTADESEAGVLVIRPVAELPTLYLPHNAGNVNITGFWYRNFTYAIEEERGFDHVEDLYQPFSIVFSLDEPATLVASTERRTIGDVQKLRDAEIDRRSQLVELAGVGDEAGRDLVLAADQFIVDRGAGKTVIAGYPWFSDWGRDTMIALPGLTLATGRPEIAKSIILEFSRHISQGMLPNRFPDEGRTPEYNTVDATLWYFEAIRAYVEQTGDIDLVRGKLFEKLKYIIEWHVLGTRYGIRVDSDGLLYAGESGFS